MYLRTMYPRAALLSLTLVACSPPTLAVQVAPTPTPASAAPERSQEPRCCVCASAQESPEWLACTWHEDPRDCQQGTEPADAAMASMELGACPHPAIALSLTILAAPGL
jgi:hypothetical protein